MTWKAGCLGELADLFVWEPPSWRKSAACRTEGKTTWMFYYEKSGRSSAYELQVKALARSICTNCPVRWKCLAEYIDEPAGIFGGLDADERAGIRLSKRHRRSPVALQQYFAKDDDVEIVEMGFSA